MTALSIGDRLDLAGGRPTGFDYLRLSLALLVIANHAPLVSLVNNSNLAWEMPWLVPSRMILPMFFALSGFLIAGSLERCRTLVSFFGLRVIRIVPALAVETLISALLLGPLFTNLDLHTYFSDPLFSRYFLNILGEPQYFLPGVFTDNPVTQVNRQLWTIPFELACYVVIGVLAVIGLRRQQWLAVPALIAVMIFSVTARHIIKGGMPDIAQAMPGELLVAAFLGGVIVYFYRYRLPSSRLWMVSLFLVSALLVTLPGYWVLLSPLPVALLTVAIGVRNPARTGAIRGADYSYGIFLYGFPLQQMLVALFPEANGLLVALLGASVLSYIVAGASWHWIEKPALLLRRQVRWTEDRWLEWRARHQATLLPATEAPVGHAALEVPQTTTS